MPFIPRYTVQHRYRYRHRIQMLPVPLRIAMRTAAGALNLQDLRQ